MQIDDHIRKCVVFLGLKLADGTFRAAGSAFIFGEPVDSGGVRNVCLVTARHVIENIKALALTEIWVRINLKSGNAEWRPSTVSQWYLAPERAVDLAFIDANVDADWDHLVFPTTLAASANVIGAQQIGIGEEVFIVGLFSHHFGNARNIPIVRLGNIAAMTEERVQTRLGPMDAYLIEARSIGGLSGSPVFVNPGPLRSTPTGVSLNNSQRGPFLLGVVHGHYDAELNIEPADPKAGLSVEKINMGIAIVTPIHVLSDAHAKYVRERG
jgi:hypothetical protein